MELWTDMHIKTLLPSIFIMAAAALVLGKCLAKKSERIRMLPFQFFAVLLFVLEIVKQAKSFSQGYDLYHIPLHFCSLFVFMLPLLLSRQVSKRCPRHYRRTVCFRVRSHVRLSRFDLQRARRGAVFY